MQIISRLTSLRVPRLGVHRSYCSSVCAMATKTATARASAQLLVIANPETPELSVLKQLPPNVKIVGIGQKLQDFRSLSDEDWASVDVLLNCGVGKNAGKKEDIMELWPRLTGLVWMHSSSAGLEHLLFPALQDSPVLLSNARGVYSHSLAEWSLTACSWFAKDFPRLMRAKSAHSWDPYEVEELRGKTLGVIGYGDIGASCARLARAFKMRVVALRRRTALSAEETREGVLDKLYAPHELNDLMAVSDYVIMATPYTPATHQLVGEAAIGAMKPNAVFVNVGRGKCVDEPALIKALSERRIRGAALDVVATEPLPPDSPLWSLDNVLLSPHCADKTKEFQFETLEFFVSNINRYLSGQELLNVVDKHQGY